MYCLRCVVCRLIEWFQYGQPNDKAIMHCRECGGQMEPATFGKKQHSLDSGTARQQS